MVMNLFILFLSLARFEIVEFTPKKNKLSVGFRLDENNINTGYFEVLNTDNMKIQASILGVDEKKVLFNSPEDLPLGEKVRFSFNNTEGIDVVLEIKASLIDSSLDANSLVEFKFDSTIDSFNQKVSKKLQYEPAIASLDHILKKLEKVTAITKSEYELAGNLGKEQRRMFSFVFFISNVSFMLFVALNIFQFYKMKSYLNQKKYL